jgi:hypothetical protein
VLQVNVPISNSWSGRIWARTGCSFDAKGVGPCEVGDCGNKLQCNGAGGVPPVSLAEFTTGDVDFYDVSFVDGVNVPIEVIFCILQSQITHLLPASLYCGTDSRRADYALGGLH